MRTSGRPWGGRWGAPVAAAALLLALAACTGCAASAHTCVDCAPFPDEAARTEAAELVVDATVRERAGTRAMLGTEAPVWEVEVVAVVAGDAAPGDRLRVAVTPVTCSADGGGDPLDVDHAVRLWLERGDPVDGSGDGWRTLTPYDGVRPLPSAVTATASPTAP